MAFDVQQGKIVPKEEDVLFMVAKTSFDAEIASALSKIAQVAHTCQREVISHCMYKIQEGALITVILAPSNRGGGRLVPC